MIDDQLKKLYMKLGLELPSHEEHGQFDPSDYRVKTSNWTLVGPGRLRADTSEGPLTVNIPNDLICKGTDERGLPILARINS